MAKYLIAATYTQEGLNGLMKDGGSARRAAAEASIKSLGGRVESFYFAFGYTDSFVVVDLPDHASASALSMAINRSGKVQARVTVLLTPEEVDQAVKKSVTYRPPGG